MSNQPKVQWVTDRLPDDGEYPVLCNMGSEWDIDHHPASIGSLREYHLRDGWRWVSLSDLLGEKP